MRHLPNIPAGLCRARNGGTDTANPVLSRLEDDRDTQVRFIEETLSRVDEEQRDLVEAEENNLRAARDRIKRIDEQLEPLREFEELRSAHRSTASSYRPTGGSDDEGRRGLSARTEPRGREYRSAGEVIVDRILAHDGNDTARESLAGAGLRTGIPEVDRQIGQARAVAHQITDDTPGLLPEQIIGAIDSDTDAARPFMTSVGVKPLSTPGKTFERPVVTQHTAAGEQTAEKTELVSQKLIISGVPFTKRTFGGSLNVSRQEIDWTSPSAWNAILGDLQEQYALETEAAASAAFETAVVATTELANATGTRASLDELSTALYEAAADAYGGTGRLPDHVWMSLDMWALYGPVLDQSVQLLANATTGNSSDVSTFTGQVLRLPRTVVPSLPAGTFIVGVKSKTEVYEERIGLLQAVQPSVLGVEIAYGGYVAFGTLRAAGFGKIVNAV